MSDPLPIRCAGFTSPQSVMWVTPRPTGRCGHIFAGVYVSFDEDDLGGVLDANDILAVADAIRAALKRRAKRGRAKRASK